MNFEIGNSAIGEISKEIYYLNRGNQFESLVILSRTLTEVADTGPENPE